MVFAVVHSVRPVWNSVTKTAEKGLIYNPLETGTVQSDSLSSAQIHKGDISDVMKGCGVGV